jgi:hypothetical protein
MNDTAALMLRLSDVGPGYTIGDDTGCGIGTENAPGDLAQAVIAHLPESCGIQFENYRLSPYIESGVLSFRTIEGVQSFFALRQDLVKYTTGLERLATDVPQAGLGDEARLITTRHAFAGGSGTDRPGAIVIWRRGLAIGTVLVAGPRADRGVRLAQRLALRQDARIRTPTPIAARDNDDLEVPLADARVGVPVRWLGRRLSGGRGLPALDLAHTFGPERPEEGIPGFRARLEYDPRRPRRAGIGLDLFRPRDWRRFHRASSSRALWKSPCTRTRRSRTAGGRAVVYAGYARLPRSGACPARRRDTFAALVFLRRVVVAIEMPYCDRCADGVVGRQVPYNSARGMTAVVRKLRPWRP